MARHEVVGDLHDHGYGIGEHPSNISQFPVRRLFDRLSAPALKDPTPEQVMAEVELQAPKFLDNLRHSGRDVISHLQSPTGKIVITSAVGIAAFVGISLIGAKILHKHSPEK